MMDDYLVIELAGEPVAKGRPRFSTRGKIPVAYSPAKTKHYEAALQYAASEAMDGRPLFDCPLFVAVVIKRKIPQSWSQKKRTDALAGRIYPVTRPDLDNHEKILDALNEVVWVDDAQVCFKTSSKVYSDKPGIRIEVMPLPEKAGAA